MYSAFGNQPRRRRMKSSNQNRELGQFLKGKGLTLVQLAHIIGCLPSEVNRRCADGGLDMASLNLQVEKFRSAKEELPPPFGEVVPGVSLNLARKLLNLSIQEAAARFSCVGEKEWVAIERGWSGVPSRLKPLMREALRKRLAEMLVTLC